MARHLPGEGGKGAVQLAGLGAQNSGELKSGKPSTIASPDCWDKRVARRRRGRNIHCSNTDIRWTGIVLRMARLKKERHIGPRYALHNLPISQHLETFPLKPCI